MGVFWVRHPLFPILGILAPVPRGPESWKNPISLERLKISSFRLKLSISLENFNLAWNFQSWPWEIPTKKNRGLGWVARLKCSISLENVIRFNLAWKFQSRRAILKFFKIWALWVRGKPECTKIAHRRSLAIFAADEGIAGNSAARTIFTHFIRRRNRGSLAIFFAEEIAHLGASKDRAIFLGAVKIAAAAAENRAILVHSGANAFLSRDRVVPDRWPFHDDVDMSAPKLLLN